jgi:hypothetical protein
MCRPNESMSVASTAMIETCRGSDCASAANRTYLRCRDRARRCRAVSRSTKLDYCAIGPYCSRSLAQNGSQGMKWWTIAIGDAAGIQQVLSTEESLRQK